MPTRASGYFDVKSWLETPYADLGDGAKLARATVTQSFDGDLAGDGAVEFLMAYNHDGTGSFVGLQRITGRLAGRMGSFVLMVTGTFAGERAGATWAVVPGSATGQLKGLRGTGGFPQHQGRRVPITLDYDFDADLARHDAQEPSLSAD